MIDRDVSSIYIGKRKTVCKDQMSSQTVLIITNFEFLRPLPHPVSFS